MALAEMFISLAICVTVYYTTLVANENGAIEQPDWAQGVFIGATVNTCLAAFAFGFLRRAHAQFKETPPVGNKNKNCKVELEGRWN